LTPSPPPDLSELRRRLDEVDRALVDLLARRQAIVADVARVKLSGSAHLRDTRREEDLLTRIVEHARAQGLDAYFVTRVFREIMSHSLRSQQERLADRDNPDRTRRIVVAFQGAQGAYSHLAARQHFSARDALAEFVGFDTFADMLDAVRDGRCDYAMLPVENTTAGSINAAYDLLARTDLAVVGEELQDVDHCLLTLGPVALSDIRRIYSHPAALDQCSNFLGTLPNVRIESYTDTALSARKVRDDGDPSQAAIASEEAARLYGLHVLRRGIANQRDNCTRMMVVARKPARYDTRIPCKTSIIFATPHEEGALLKALNVLAAHHLNLTKLESRPRPGVPWQYLFYVDFEGNLANPDVEQAMRELAHETAFLRVLGSYPSRTTRHARPAEPRPAPRTRPTRHPRRRPAPIHLGPLEIAPTCPVLIAGRGSTPDLPAILAQARTVRDAGARALWGGPFSADPDGQPAAPLDHAVHLAQAAADFGLAAIAEPLTPADAQALALRVHALRLGPTAIHNHALLREVGRLDKPVILTRGNLVSTEDWLAAARLLMDRGNRQVILCDEGLRGLDGSARRSLDIAALAEITQTAGLPILIDPTFLVARTDPDRLDRILALCRAALALGVAGVFARLADTPGEDHPGSLDAEGLSRLAGGLEPHERFPTATPVAPATGSSGGGAIAGQTPHNMPLAP
jgi:chorismate mutase/prephenate dehydratase